MTTKWRELREQLPPDTLKRVEEKVQKTINKMGDDSEDEFADEDDDEESLSDVDDDDEDDSDDDDDDDDDEEEEWMTARRANESI